MTEQPEPPSLEKVQKWAVKMQDICKRWDALIVVTDYMIGELEEQIRLQPNEIYRLKRAKRLLNLDPEKSAAVETHQEPETTKPIG